MDWSVAFKSNKLYQAQIVVDFLKDNDIEALIVNKQDSFYKFGQHEVQVPADKVIRALKLIDDNIRFD